TLSILGSISIPLYDSGLINSKLRKSSLLENKFKLNALHTQNEVIENITNNWNLLESLEDSLSSENNFLLVNIEILKAIDEERKIGISSNLDFLNAQNSVIQSKIRLSKFQFDQLYYSYKLLNSIGRLNLKSLLS
ncbi:TolC family protein, partial [Hyphomicrobiales bacterium]|nr:TolC family protein [Hyphomicrobiales bacterium]